MKSMQRENNERSFRGNILMLYKLVEFIVIILNRYLFEDICYFERHISVYKSLWPSLLQFPL